MFVADPSKKPTDIYLYTLHPVRPRKIAESDPAVKGGLFRSRVFPYQPMLMGTLA